MSYWAEVHHWRQIEYVLDKSLGMILLGRIENRHAFSVDEKSPWTSAFFCSGRPHFKVQGTVIPEIHLGIIHIAYIAQLHVLAIIHLFNHISH
jgi:hypothetical protein